MPHVCSGAKRVCFLVVVTFRSEEVALDIFLDVTVEMSIVLVRLTVRGHLIMFVWVCIMRYRCGVGLGIECFTRRECLLSDRSLRAAARQRVGQKPIRKLATARQPEDQSHHNHTQTIFSSTVYVCEIMYSTGSRNIETSLCSSYISRPRLAMAFLSRGR